MPLHIIRQDITKISCDAIVNAANSTLLGGGGVDGAIHRAAGVELLNECRSLGGCQTGEAKITRGYNLPCKYVIHTVGPIWRGGTSGERELLAACYNNSLLLAREYGLNTVAFPLISAGAYGYPKAEALSVASETISKFLLDNEMTVFIVVFDRDSYKISEKLYRDVAEYIDDNYVDENAKSDNRRYLAKCEHISYNALTPCQTALSFSTKLEEMLSKMDDNFAVTLLKLIDHKGVTDVQCYKKANVSKQTWYKIMNDKSYKPSKNTVIAFAIALELTLEETCRLLATAGFAFSKSCKFDVIIEYFIRSGIYDIFAINEALFKFDQTCLGV